MKKILILFFILLGFRGFSQPYFDSNCAKPELQPDIIKRLACCKRTFDFQMRYWKDSGILNPPKYDLFIATLKDSVWECSAYQIIYTLKGKAKIHKNETGVIVCDSVWKYIQQFELLNLPDMKKLENKLLIKNEEGEYSRFVILDCIGYTFELLAPQKYRRIEYYCPEYYAGHYPAVIEFQHITKIVNFINNYSGF